MQILKESALPARRNVSGETSRNVRLEDGEGKGPRPHLSRSPTQIAIDAEAEHCRRGEDCDNHKEAGEKNKKRKGKRKRKKRKRIIEANPVGESKEDESRSSIESAENKSSTNSQASESHHEVGGQEGEVYLSENQTVNQGTAKCWQCLRHHGIRYEYFVRVEQKGNSAGVMERGPIFTHPFGFYCVKCESTLEFFPIVLPLTEEKESQTNEDELFQLRDRDNQDHPRPKTCTAL